MNYDSTPDTAAHIQRVRELLDAVQHHLWQRGQAHDRSKLREPEKSAFDRATPRLKATTYGSPEYKEERKRLGEALEHHYGHNRHHPEHEKVSREEWRPVVGHEGSYEVSNLGEVRSVTRLVSRKGKQGDLTRQGQVMKPHLTPKGYLRVQLRKGGKPVNRFIHSLVAEAFLPDHEEGMQVNHRNGYQKQDNRVENLEWVTPSENLQHAYDSGLKSPNAKYVVTCQLPNGDEISTVGTTQMAKRLIELGYPASASGIWYAAVGDSETHCGLTFKAEPVAEPATYSGINGMSLLDLIEMVCDWKAAGERHTDGDIRESLRINIERFDIDPQLASVLEVTIDELFPETDAA